MNILDILRCKEGEIQQVWYVKCATCDSERISYRSNTTQVVASLRKDGWRIGDPGWQCQECVNAGL